MIRHLGSSLTDITYVFDEPTIGLHPHDIERMNQLLLQLRDKGNTVLVVEHKPETIAIADHVVDLGPARTGGGTVCFEGDLEGLRGGATPSPGATWTIGRPLRTVCVPPQVIWKSGGRLNKQPQERRRRHPPLGVLCVLTGGVAGSGKSSLIHAP